MEMKKYVSKNSLQSILIINNHFSCYFDVIIDYGSTGKCRFTKSRIR